MSIYVDTIATYVMCQHKILLCYTWHMLMTMCRHKTYVVDTVLTHNRYKDAIKTSWHMLTTMCRHTTYVVFVLTSLSSRAHRYITYVDNHVSIQRECACAYIYMCRNNLFNSTYWRIRMLTIMYRYTTYVVFDWTIFSTHNLIIA